MDKSELRRSRKFFSYYFNTKKMPIVTKDGSNISIYQVFAVSFILVKLVTFRNVRTRNMFAMEEEYSKLCK